jgi:hypothetical protein
VGSENNDGIHNFLIPFIDLVWPSGTLFGFLVWELNWDIPIIRVVGLVLNLLLLGDQAK